MSRITEGWNVWVLLSKSAQCSIDLNYDKGCELAVIMASSAKSTEIARCPIACGFLCATHVPCRIFHTSVPMIPTTSRHEYQNEAGKGRQILNRRSFADDGLVWLGPGLMVWCHLILHNMVFTFGDRVDSPVIHPGLRNASLINHVSPLVTSYCAFYLWRISRQCCLGSAEICYAFPIFKYLGCVACL